MKAKSPLFQIDRLLIAALALLATFGATHEAKAQTLFVLSSSNYTQNFNSLSNSASTNVPTGWFITTTATNFTGTTNVTQAYGTTGTGAVSGSSSGGAVNWGNGTNATATDRALGFLNANAYTTGKSLVFGFTNNTGSSVTNLSLAWDYEKYRSGSRAWTWTFAYSTDGSSWITNSSGGLAYAADANNTTVFNPPTTTTNISLNIGSLSIGNSSSVYLRWTLDGDGGSSNGQGLAIDNFSMTATYAGAAGSGIFWTANGSTLGGAGTWDTSGLNWSTAASPVSGAAWDSTKTAVFTNSAATVTVSTVTASNGVQFSTDGYTLSSSTITLGGSAIASNTITTDANVGATIGSKLSGTAGMTKAGAGTLTLTGANDYTGGTLISSGTLVGNTTSLQGTITNNAGIVFNQTADGTLSTALSGSGALTKIGSATLSLSAANSFSGAMTISNGAVRLANNTASGTTAGGITVVSGAALELSNGITVGAEALSLNGAGISSGGALRSVSGNNTYGGAITNTGGVTIAADSGSTMTLSGGINLNTGTMTVGGDGNTFMSGSVTNGSVTKSGAGTVTFSNTATSFGALTTGTGETAFATNARITGLAGSGALNLVGGTLTLTNTAAQTFSGAITGAGGFTKTGAETLTLSGSGSYSGPTTISIGTILVAANNALSTNSAVTVGVSAAPAGTIRGQLSIGDGFSQAITGLTLFGGATNTNSGRVIIGTGYTLTVNGNITYENANNGSYPSAISGGTLDLGGSNRTITVWTNGNASLGGDLGIDSVIANGSIVKEQSGILRLSGANTFAGTFSNNAGVLWISNANALQNATLDVGASAASRTVSFIIPTATTYNIGALAGADALEISNNTLSLGGNNANASMTGAITGTGGNITKVGLGTQTLSSSGSTYSGTTTVSAGALRVETSANTLGSS
ncbi:MAG: beta strand repeat-containing protein, partial [Sphaerospermopsis kisseleviana]